MAEKWQAAKGAAPTECDVEAMWKDLPQVRRPSITSPRLNQAVSDQINITPTADGAADCVGALVAQRR